MSDTTQPVGTETPLSFFGRVKAELVRLFHHVPGWEASAAATMTYVAPMIDLLMTITEPAAAPAIAALLAKVQSAMAAAAVVIKMAGPEPTLLTYLTAISDDLVQLEAAAQIKDPQTAAKLVAIVAAVKAEVEAIRAEVEGLKNVVAAPAQA